MNLSLKSCLWFSFAFLMLLVSSWYFSREPIPRIRLDEKTLSTTPDLFVHTLSVKKYNERGLLVNNLESPFMQHFPKNNSHVFKNPHVLITQEDQSSLEIHAQKAEAIHGGEEITFLKEVVVHQKESASQAPSVLKTEKIVYYSKKKIATTDLPVAFEQAGNTVHSEGMTAWLAEKRVKLNQARGRYAPKQQDS